MEQYLFILRNSPFFQGMTKEEILSVLHCVSAVVQRKKKDEYILRVGDSTESMGLVLRGSRRTCGVTGTLSTASALGNTLPSLLPPPRAVCSM